MVVPSGWTKITSSDLNEILRQGSAVNAQVVTDTVDAAYFLVTKKMGDIQMLAVTDVVSGQFTFDNSKQLEVSLYDKNGLPLVFTAGNVAIPIASNKIGVGVPIGSVFPVQAAQSGVWSLGVSSVYAGAGAQGGGSVVAPVATATIVTVTFTGPIGSKLQIQCSTDLSNNLAAADVGNMILYANGGAVTLIGNLARGLNPPMRYTTVALNEVFTIAAIANGTALVDYTAALAVYPT